MLGKGETLELLKRNSSWGLQASGQGFVGCGSERDPEHRLPPHYNSDDALTKVSMEKVQKYYDVHEKSDSSKVFYSVSNISNGQNEKLTQINLNDKLTKCNSSVVC